VKDLSQHYKHLTAEERFRLFVQAMGRGDDQELDRLEYTCERKTYSQQDWAYTNRKLTFVVFSLCHALETAQAQLFAAIALGLHSIMADDNPEQADDIMTHFLRFMQVSHGRQAGWVRFCEELGVEPSAITARFMEHSDCTENLLDTVYAAARDTCDDLASNEEAIANIADAQAKGLAEAWASKVR
jgi:hypothetical protein